MFKHRRTLLAFVLVVLTSATVYAQGLGLGLGFDDRLRRGSNGPPAPDGLLLVAGGNITLVGGGRLLCVGSC